MMLSYQDTAVVLRHHNLGEADKIITLLTAEHGLIRMVARGVRRTHSKFGARLEVFNSINAMLHPPKHDNGLGIILSVEQICAPSKILGGDYEKFTAACAIVETAERLAGIESSPVTPLVRLTINALNALAEGTRCVDLIVIAYIIRAIEHSGWLPTLQMCAICSTPGLYPDFHIPSGGVVCPDCRPIDYCTPGENTIILLNTAYQGKWDNITCDNPQLYRETLTLTARYTQWHIGRNITSLNNYVNTKHSLT